MNGVKTDEDGRPQVVFCADCGLVHGEATALLEETQAIASEAQQHLQHIEEERRIQRDRIHKLQREAYERAKNSAHYLVAREVLERWRELCHPKARELEGNHRLEHCVARLKGGYKQDELDRSVDGYARFPYVVEKRRSPIGPPSRWYADAELIFRTPGHVNTGIRLAGEQHADIPYALLSMVPWQRVRELNRRTILSYLRRRFGGLVEEDGYVYSPCPRCDDGTAMRTPLVVAPASLHYLVECRSCGLDEARLLSSLRQRPHVVEQTGHMQLELIA